MRNGVRLLAMALLMACSAACGSGTSTVTTTYRNYSSNPVLGSAKIMGGSVQGTQLPLAAKTIKDTVVSTIAGTSGSHGKDDGVGPAAKFNLVNGIATDGSYLYVTDYGNHTIRRVSIAFSNTSTTRTIAGTAETAGTSDNTTAGVVARFYNPSGITLDVKGERTNLYVADYNNHTIRMVSFSNISTVPVYHVTTIAGSAGTAGSYDATTGTDARFYHPTDITTDGKHLYVTDTSNLTIRKIGMTSPYSVYTVAGSPGKSGSNAFNKEVLGINARFQYPARITTDGTNLYVTDFINNTISQIYTDSTNSTTYVKTIVGTPRVTGSADGIGAAASFSNINGITSDGTNLYVTDYSNHAVRRVVPTVTGSTTTWTVTTIAGYVGSDDKQRQGAANGFGSDARFKFPVGITTDGTSLYVADSNNYTIRKIQ